MGCERWSVQRGGRVCRLTAPPPHRDCGVPAAVPAPEAAGNATLQAIVAQGAQARCWPETGWTAGRLPVSLAISTQLKRPCLLPAHHARILPPAAPQGTASAARDAVGGVVRDALAGIVGPLESILGRRRLSQAAPGEHRGGAVQGMRCWGTGQRHAACGRAAGLRRRTVPCSHPAHLSSRDPVPAAPLCSASTRACCACRRAIERRGCRRCHPHRHPGRNRRCRRTGKPLPVAGASGKSRAWRSFNVRGRAVADPVQQAAQRRG